MMQTIIYQTNNIYFLSASFTKSIQIPRKKKVPMQMETLSFGYLIEYYFL